MTPKCQRLPETKLYVSVLLPIHSELTVIHSRTSLLRGLHQRSSPSLEYCGSHSREEEDVVGSSLLFPGGYTHPPR